MGNEYYYIILYFVLVFIGLGIITLDIKIKIGLGLFLYIIMLCIIFFVDNISEKGYTLYKLFNHFNLKYGDTLNFVYHIKTRKHKKEGGSIDKDRKTPKCKIEGKIENNNLIITKLSDECDNNESVKDKYKNLITHTGNFDDNESIHVNSEIKDFTWS